MKNRTELVFILDKSGSMSGLEDDTMGGFNAMLKQQKEIEGDCTVTTVLFDNQYELLHDRIPLQAIQALTKKEYFVGGSTALLDAMGRTIHKLSRVQEQTGEEYRAENVLFVIITDGQENASREYSLEKVKTMVEHHQTNDEWEFVFMSASMDAIETAHSVGISTERTSYFEANAEGVQESYHRMNEEVKNYRTRVTQKAKMKED